VTIGTSVRRRTKLRRCSAPFVYLSLATSACGGRLDAGWDEPRGVLPVDERNPILLCNDGYSDNWEGEYAILFASTGSASLVGIVVNDGWPWTNIDDNMSGWRQMVDAARDSGLRNIPDPLASPSSTLVRPSDEDVDSTTPNESDGARFIIEASYQWSQPFRPLVVVTGGRLTDVADAYLMDHTLPERIVVVSSLGAANTDGAEMGVPNGELDTWANIIVAQKFRYVQVSAYYDQSLDVPSSLLAQLPTNAFTSWINTKQPDIKNAYDQVGLLVVVLPAVVSSVTPVVQQGTSSNNMPLLVRDSDGPDLLVTQVSGALAAARFGEMLLAPATFGSQ
jgi:hypothetical protein